jgi:hypothetical protein
MFGRVTRDWTYRRKEGSPAGPPGEGGREVDRLSKVVGGEEGGPEVYVLVKVMASRGLNI